jgi:CBS domain-containing protein
MREPEEIAMRVTEIMTAEPVCCTPETPLSAVARLMLDNDCGEIPVVDQPENRRLLGVVTDRDIVCRAIAKSKDPEQTSAGDVMSSPAISVSEDADLDECCERMEQHQIRRIPVVDAGGRVSGIVSQADIALKSGAMETGKMVRDISQPARIQ